MIQKQNTVLEIPRILMVPAGLIGGTVVGIFTIMFGIFLTLAIPYIGFVFGILFFILGVTMPFSGIFSSNKITRTQYCEGKCPRCENSIKARVREKVVKCSNCRHKLLITPKGFELL